MTNLVIVESPAKCSKIQGFLGFGWKVIASLGHIRRLKEDLDAVGLEKDFEPSWEWMKEKVIAINQIKDLAKSANAVYLASDDDREGELIAYSVCTLLKLDPVTTPRAVFHEITETAVKSAIQNPRRLDMDKVNAAQSRVILDMMIGFTMSPLLWKSVGPALSAGRCQTPALRLVADREAEIQSFKPASSWKLYGEWSPINNASWKWEANLTDELEDQDSAENFLEMCHNKSGGTILNAQTSQWTESPPIPLITSTLQQKASTLFRCGPKDTMKVAQRLYEAGHITYMRTDKAVLSEEAIESAQNFIREKYGEEYIGSSGGKKTTKKGKKTTSQEGPKAQEAHEAIRPTHMELDSLPTDEDWSARDRKIYKLIWQTTLQSVMSSHRGEQRTIHFVADGEDSGDFQWRASWRRSTFLGWRMISQNQFHEQDSSQEDTLQQSAEEDWNKCLSLKMGDRLQWNTLGARPHETRAPQRYTEATLIRELEQRGIGRPSTFASLISAILDKTYVCIKNFDGREVELQTLLLTQLNQWPPERQQKMQKLGAEKDRLTTTPLGVSVLEFLLSHFEDLFTYSFTAQMETRLDTIAEGREPWKQILRDTWDAYSERYHTLKASAGSSGSSDRRKEFGDGVVAILGKKGPLILKESPDGDKTKTIFYGWPEGIGFQALTEQDVQRFVERTAKVQEGVLMGELNELPVIVKQGKFGTYAEWNGQKVSCTPQDTMEVLHDKFIKTTSHKRIGQFEIRQGPYGLYMFKWAITGPSRKFVGLPSDKCAEDFSEGELIHIFQAGLQQKARSGQYSKTNGSGGETSTRGRGGWRGRGRGRGRGQ